MDTLLQNGDFAVDVRGLPESITGIRELIQQCLIRLSVRRGSFACDKNLGSRLYSLPKADTAILSELAEAYIAEALEDMPHAVAQQVVCSYDSSADRTTVELQLELKGQSYDLEVEF